MFHVLQSSMVREKRSAVNEDADQKDMYSLNSGDVNRGMTTPADSHHGNY